MGCRGVAGLAGGAKRLATLDELAALSQDLDMGS